MNQLESMRWLDASTALPVLDSFRLPRQSLPRFPRGRLSLMLSASLSHLQPASGQHNPFKALRELHMAGPISRLTMHEQTRDWLNGEMHWVSEFIM